MWADIIDTTSGCMLTETGHALLNSFTLSWLLECRDNDKKYWTAQTNTIW